MELASVRMLVLFIIDQDHNSLIKSNMQDENNRFLQQYHTD